MRLFFHFEIGRNPVKLGYIDSRKSPKVEAMSMAFLKLSL